METKKIFSKILVELREKRHLTRQQLADDLGVTRASLEYYEKGKRAPDISMIVKIANYFEVTCDYLLRGVEAENLDISKNLGLTDSSIKNLTFYNNIVESFSPYLDILNALLSNSQFLGYCADIKEFIEHHEELANDRAIIKKQIDKLRPTLREDEYGIPYDDDDYREFNKLSIKSKEISEKIEFLEWKYSKMFQEIVKELIYQSRGG